MKGFRLSKLDSLEYVIVIVLSGNIGKFTPPWTLYNGTVDPYMKELFENSVIVRMYFLCI